MKIEILPAANEDLINGYHFYEQQQTGIGDYFLDSLFADINSLIIYHGAHRLLFNHHEQHQRIVKSAHNIMRQDTGTGSDE
jgi:hypothetical protein